MKAILRAFAVVHACMAALFACAALLLIAVSVRMVWSTLQDGFGDNTAQVVIDAIGYLAAAVVGIQIAQTIAEEEVVREAHIGAPTRVRRFLSRFLVVVVVALAIEGLVATFRASHDDLAQLWPVSGLILSISALVAAWGVFLHFNREAEELEPEAMEDAKEEDEKLK